MNRIESWTSHRLPFLLIATLSLGDECKKSGKYTYVCVCVMRHRQKTEAEQIEQTAREALNTSREALRIAETAIQKPSNVAYDIELIKRRYVHVNACQRLLNFVSVVELIQINFPHLLSG